MLGLCVGSEAPVSSLVQTPGTLSSHAKGRSIIPHGLFIGSAFLAATVFTLLVTQT